MSPEGQKRDGFVRICCFLAIGIDGGVGREVENRVAKELADAIFGKRKEGDDADPEDEGRRNAAESLLKEGLGKFLGR